jgi:serine-type D-Ala-D-Ala carboxypeptidase (penicillin-binding protein 5/6)
MLLRPLFLACALLLPAAAAVGTVAAPRPAAAFETAARAAIVVDYRTNATLYAKDADARIPPASMSKLMTAYMVFERLKEGSLKLDDTLPVSEKAWRVEGSEMFVKVGDRVRVEDLLRGMIIQSGNDACIVFAEALAGSEAAFSERMSERAVELGMTNSHFANSTGLPDPQHYMSVRDLATLAVRIIREFPEYYKYYSEKEFTFNNIRQPNRNPLLQAGVPGVDGMKTGFTKEAGYGLVASAERDGRRIVTVIAGLDSTRNRRGESEQLLEYGFREWQEYRLFEPGQTVAEAGVWLGSAERVPLVPQDVVGVTLSREARKGMNVKLRYDSPVPAPVAKGQPLGALEISAPGSDVVTVPLVAGQEVPKAGMLGRITGAISYLVFGASAG